MSVMVVLLEFVRWEIGDKKGPKNEGLVRSLHAFSGRVRSTQSLSGGWAAHSCFGARIHDDVQHGLVTDICPSHPLIKWASRNKCASSEGRWARSVQGPKPECLPNARMSALASCGQNA